ncbi:MAG: selenide, water dikinase SelD, partial [Chloroflexota bacterium]
PEGNLPPEILTEILRGGAEKVREAGIAVAGGHTVTDNEPKYGLAVTGIVHPDRIITKGGAKPGDTLILTKPLGVGVITTALKRDIATEEEIAIATESMSRLNKAAAEAAQAVGVHAMTDITGFGLIGHAREMASNSAIDFDINFDQIGWLPGAHNYAEQGIFPGGMVRNKDHFEQHVTFADHIADPQRDLLFDPETSGGLLIAVDSADADELLNDLIVRGCEAAVIGRVRLGEGKLHIT